jgi:hypothetical protein
MEPKKIKAVVSDMTGTGRVEYLRKGQGEPGRDLLHEIRYRHSGLSRRENRESLWPTYGRKELAVSAHGFFSSFFSEAKIQMEQKLLLTGGIVIMLQISPGDSSCQRLKDPAGCWPWMRQDDLKIDNFFGFSVVRFWQSPGGGKEERNGK